LIADILGNTVWKLDQERNIKTDMDLAQQNVTCLLTHFLILMREIPGKTTLVSPLKILSLKPQKMVVSKLCNLWGAISAYHHYKTMDKVKEQQS
jgi:hypothetical protein